MTDLEQAESWIREYQVSLNKFEKLRSSLYYKTGLFDFVRFLNHDSFSLEDRIYIIKDRIRDLENYKHYLEHPVKYLGHSPSKFSILNKIYNYKFEI